MNSLLSDMVEHILAEASLANKTYHCDVVVTKKGAVLRFPAQAFRAALDEDADFRGAWMTHLAR